jgi:hypothetical protein
MTKGRVLFSLFNEPSEKRNSQKFPCIQFWRNGGDNCTKSGFSEPYVRFFCIYIAENRVLAPFHPNPPDEGMTFNRIDCKIGDPFLVITPNYRHV